MPLTSDLMGIGQPAAQADLLGFNAANPITAAGTTTANATVLTKGQEVIVLTGTGADGVRLAADCPVGCMYLFTCIAGGGIVYPPTGGTFNGLSANTGITIGANKSGIAMRYSNLGWYFNLSA